MVQSTQSPSDSRDTDVHRGESLHADKRPQHVALFGLLLQLVVFGSLAGVAYWSHSPAIGAAARFMLTGVPIWVVLYLVFKQLRRVRSERFETAELKRTQASGTGGAIFELDDEALLLEQNRLRWMIRWMLPATTVVTTLWLVIGHFVGWGWSFEEVFLPAHAGGLERTINPTMMMWFVVFSGFLCFLFGRYAGALSRLSEWRLLHAGASFMTANALVCLILSVTMMATATIEWVEPAFAYVMRWFMLLLGIELTFNFMFDFYRPRQPGVVGRPSFDSRLLGLVSEPGGIAKSIAEAMNYQFGFEVSTTWFYQLLQRCLFPISVATAVIILLLSSVVIVDADERAVIERFGRPLPGDAGILKPGLAFKWPYPIDLVWRAPVKKIGEVVIGERHASGDETNDDARANHGHDAVLWTEAHDYEPELMLLVGAPALGTDKTLDRDEQRAGSESHSVAVSLLMVSIPVEYRIANIKQYLHNYVEPEKLLEAVAYQYLSEYAAGVDIDELMGPGRHDFNDELRSLIQQRLDEMEVGIEIVFVGVRSAHPPAEDGVAKAFQAAISAETEMRATIHTAEGEARKILASTAGTETRARAVNDAIVLRDRLQAAEQVDAVALEEARRAVDVLMVGDPERDIEPMSGAAAAMIAQARAYASELVSKAAAKVRMFSTEVTAYEAAPELYLERKKLSVYTDLDMARKYVILGDAAKVIIEYDDDKPAGLDQVLSEGVKKEKKKVGR